MVTTRRLKIFAMTGICLGLVLAGCGRKSALEVPGAATQAPANTAASESNVPAAGTSEPAAPASNGGFILDPLIGQ
ncbi:lipoprotein [Labrenzia sp. PHM005]|uniref:lipoprotein n=1 Tax=Stappiaceae TaxID=2821832 RepID=UPI0011401F3E|nr:hypothetical protein [Labrenzia sp. PHM005]QDG75296.1 hypothetical protein FJ695_05130 [Labrenzia sp. PHM005]